MCHKINWKLPQFTKSTVKNRLKADKLNYDMEVGEGFTRNISNRKITIKTHYKVFM